MKYQIARKDKYETGDKDDSIEKQSIHTRFAWKHKYLSFMYAV